MLKPTTQLRDIGHMEIELIAPHPTLAERVARLASVSGTVLGLQVTTPHVVLRPVEPMPASGPPKSSFSNCCPVADTPNRSTFGQAVTLVFWAFPTRPTREPTGHITVTPADALTGPQNQQLYDRTKIAPGASELGKRQGLKLLPVMPVEDFLRT